MTDTKQDDRGQAARNNEAMADLRVFLEEARAQGELVEVDRKSVV